MSLEDARSLAHPSFLPPGGNVRARLRFYDLTAGTRSGEVRFREAVIALIVHAGDTRGELSVRMWSDSWRYATWGREFFSWPIEMADISLNGGFWQGESTQAASAELRDPSLAIRDVRVLAPITEPASPPVWIIPRRHMALTDGGWVEVQDVYSLVPRVISLGRHYTCEGIVDVSGIFSAVDDVTIDCGEDVVLEVDMPQTWLTRHTAQSLH